MSSQTVVAEAGTQQDAGVESKNIPRFFSLFVGCYFVLIFTLITVTSFVQKSFTVDEPLHLFTGYTNLKWGDFRTNAERPPLVKMWAALPLLAFDIKDLRPSRMDHWELIHEDPFGLPALGLVSDTLLSRRDGEELFFYAKLQMIAVALLLGIFVYLWSKELFGVRAAVAALAIYALDPNILAHSQIIHTDVPFAAFFFIGTFFFWRTLNGFTWTRFLLTALFFALASVTKYSAFAILPIWAILGLTTHFLRSSQGVTLDRSGRTAARWKKTAEVASVLAASAAAAYVVIWAIYYFRFDAIPEGGHPLYMARVLPAEGTLFRRVADFMIDNHFLPEAWIYGQLYVLKYLTRTTFLLGWV
jgi:Dolichyl-phosphate-mannose-protein mannosyltransferase